MARNVANEDCARLAAAIEPTAMPPINPISSTSVRYPPPPGGKGSGELDRPGEAGLEGSRVVPGTLPRSRNLGTAGQLPVVAACWRSASEMAQAALMSPMWLKAWGKLPSSSPVAGSTSSASRPTSLR